MVRNREKRKKPDKSFSRNDDCRICKWHRDYGYLDSANAEFLDLQGVVFHACANAMRANHISESLYLNK